MAERGMDGSEMELFVEAEESAMDESLGEKEM